MLTKTTLLAARQCARRAWLMLHEPARATPTPAGQRALRDAGHAVGRLAHAIFPGAVLVEERDFAAARARTAALVADPRVPAILEAAVEHDGIGVRVDVLERLADGAFGLREVKAGTRVRDVHLDDLAIQRHVLSGAGFRIASVELVLVDPDYVRGEGPPEWTRLFQRRDVSAEVVERSATVAAQADALRATLAEPEAPAIEPSPHCSMPYRCEFWEHCTAPLPADWILHFGRVPPEQWAALRAAGTTRLAQLKDTDAVPAALQRARRSLASDGAVVTPELAAALADFGPPAEYLDFETVSAAVPLFPGTQPYQRVPFQWSLHRLDAAGTLTHFDCLATGGGDPRREFAETLLARTGGRHEPILVYSDFESDVLAEVAEALPDLAPDIEAVRARLRDLLPIMRAHVYHPGFRGSFSLKSVAPALVAGFGYGDLTGIRDGAEATVQLSRLLAGECDAASAPSVREALRAYCARDTEALVRLHAALRALLPAPA
ncbi:MAG TPA: DUF2779 domain-containing protein [Candidatus Binatia bacterium]